MVVTREDTARSRVETVLRRFCNWAGHSIWDLNRLQNDEVERIASDLRMTVSDLYAVARRGPQSAALLERRMAVLDLDRDEILRIEPGVYRDLQRVCSLCESRKECLHDLAHAPDGAQWKDYCPNVGTLLALDALPWAVRREW